MNQNPDEFHGAATTMMMVAIRSGRISVVRWLFDQGFCPAYDILLQAFLYKRSEIVQVFLDTKFLSLNTSVSSEEVLALAVQNNLEDIYGYLIQKGANLNHRDEKGRTLLFHALSSRSDNRKLMEDFLLTGLDPSAQDNTGGTPLSLSVWGKCRPRSFLLLAREDILRNILQSYDYHIACLLLQYGLDSVLEDVDMHTEWIEILTLIGKVPNMPCDTSVSVEEGPLKLSNDPKDQTQLAGQTLLSMAALFRHEKAFRVLLDWGINPACPAMGEMQKKTSIVSQIGHCTNRQEPLDPKRESNNYRMSDELRQGPLAWAT